MKIKPLLAATCSDLSSVKFPVYVSAKLDGIRSLVLEGQLVSRTLKPIPNKAIRELLSRPEFSNLDGELIIGNPTDDNVFNRTSSQVMTMEGGSKGMKFHVFDYIVDKPYYVRLEMVRSICAKYPEHLVALEQIHCTDTKLLEDLESRIVGLGFEGVMLRDYKGLYKFGRSTLKEQTLLKFKRFETSEAHVVGFEELMHNDNEATKDALGHTKRSSHQENQVPAGTLGALLVVDVKTGVEFKIGTGFTADDRKKIWDKQSYYEGGVVSYQHFPVGVVDKPRFPSFRGFRNKIDM